VTYNIFTHPANPSCTAFASFSHNGREDVMIMTFVYSAATAANTAAFLTTSASVFMTLNSHSRPVLNCQVGYCMYVRMCVFLCIYACVPIAASSEHCYVSQRHSFHDIWYVFLSKSCGETNESMGNALLSQIGTKIPEVVERFPEPSFGSQRVYLNVHEIWLFKSCA